MEIDVQKRRRSQVAKAVDCKSTIPGSNPGGASFFFRHPQHCLLIAAALVLPLAALPLIAAALALPAADFPPGTTPRGYRSCPVLTDFSGRQRLN